MMRPRPRVLHLYSDLQWTPAAESTVHLCRQLRRLGFPVDFACRRTSAAYPESLEHRARERRMEPVLDFALNAESRNPFNVVADIRAVAEFMDREEVEVVHVHHGYDHYVGSRAARKVNNRPFVVRTNHTSAPLPNGMWTRFLARGHTDAWVAPTRPILDADMASFGIAQGRGIVIEEPTEFGASVPQARKAARREPLGRAAVEESSEFIVIESHVEIVAELYLRLAEQG